MKINAHRFLWSLVIVGFAILALAVVGVSSWLGFFDWPARLAVLLAVIEFLTLVFAVFAGFVAV